ncbi:hypothetical protein BHQ15_00480 [Mycolicibacillus koreensis]|nr:hypothetical protein BHQ15_00480 [Mycolicibacillus koreensis]
MEHGQALAAKRAVIPRRIGFIVLSAVGSATAVVGCVFHPRLAAPWVWLLVLGGLVCAAAGFVGARAATARMRYQVKQSRPRFVLMMAVMPASTLVISWLYGTVAAASGPSSLAVALLTPMALLAMFATTLNTESLFDGDADGVRFLMRGLQWRRTRIPWDDVEAIVLSSCARPDRLEIAVRTRSDAVPWERRRIVVARKLVSLDGLGWAMNQSGRDDIALLSHTADGISLLGYSNAWARSIARYPSAAPDPAAA